MRFSRKKQRSSSAKSSTELDEFVAADQARRRQRLEATPDPRAAEIVARFRRIDRDGNTVGLPLWAFTSVIGRAEDLSLHIGTGSVMWRDKEFRLGPGTNWPGVLFTIGDGSGSSMRMSELLEIMARQSYITCTKEMMERCSPEEKAAIRRLAYGRIWDQRQSEARPMDTADYEKGEKLLLQRLGQAMTSFNAGQWEPKRAAKDNFADLAIRQWVEEVAPEVLSEEQRQTLALAHGRLHPAANEPTFVNEAWLQLHTGGYERLLSLANQLDVAMGE